MWLFKRKVNKKIEFQQAFFWLVVSFSFLVLPNFLNAQQNNDCFDISPFCSGQDIDFPNAVGTTAPSGPDYGCLSQQPNPVWYYFKIGESGDFLFNLSQEDANGTPLDIDFALWGPFDSVNDGCMSIINGLLAPIQCSYSSSTNETIGLGQTGGSNDYGNGESTPPNGESGEYYILLLTNFSGIDGNISLEQIGGTGTTDCSVLSPCKISQFEISDRICDETNNTFSLAGIIVFEDAPESGALIVEDCNGYSQTFYPPFVSPTNFLITEIPVDGEECNLTVYFTEATDCKLILDYQNPISCICELPEITITDIISCSSSIINLDNGVSSSSPYPPLTHYFTSEENAINNQNEISHIVSSGGTYWARIVDPYNPDCFEVYPIQVEVINLDFFDDRVLPTCLNSDGEIILFPNGGAAPYHYSIDGNETTQEENTFDNLPAGVYYVTITDSNGCEVSDTIILNNENAPQLDSVYIENPSCSGDCNGFIRVFVIDGTPQYTYNWYNTDFILLENEHSEELANLCAPPNNNIYFLEVIDANGCQLIEPIELNEPLPESAHFNLSDFCEGNSLPAFAIGTPGGIFSMVNPTNDGASIDTETGQILNGIAGNSYTVIYETQGSCPDSFSRIVKVFPKISFTVEGTDPFCKEDDGELIVIPDGDSENYSYSIDGISFQDTNVFTGLTGGTYYPTIMDENGCVWSDTTILNNVPGPKLEMDDIVVIPPTCFNDCDGSVSISVIGGLPNYLYKWYDNDSELIGTNNNSLSDLCPSSYSVEVEDQNGCVVSAKITIPNPARADASFTLNDFCEGEKNEASEIITEGGVFSFVESVTDGATINEITGEIENGVGGTSYLVQYETPSPCPEIHIESVHVFSLPEVHLTASPVTGVPPLLVTFEDGTPNNNEKTWFFGDGTESSETAHTVMHLYEDFGSYEAVLTKVSAEGCENSDTVIIEVIFEEMEYGFPNVFTPNQDGINDYFHFSHSKHIKSVEITIVNRWGNLVFESDSIDFKWNGQIQNTGQTCTDGVYFYKATLTNLKGEEKVEHGFVQLVQ